MWRCLLLATPPLLQGMVVTIFANGVINYHCKNNPGNPLHVGVLMAKGIYTA